MCRFPTFLSDFLSVMLVVQYVAAVALPQAIVSTQDIGDGHAERGSTERGVEMQEGAPWVSITVSPLLNTNPPRQLELSWAHAQNKDGDWIGLFDGDPRGTNQSSRSVTRVTRESSVAWRWVTAPEGRWLSGVGAVLAAEDVHQCAAYVRGLDNTGTEGGGGGGRVLAAWCARLFPSWMGDSKDQLGHLRLQEVLLPGTHDSGAFRRFQPGASETIVIKYAITQEEDILTQLRLGVRYLDIRVGYYPYTATRWYINHGVVRLQPLEEAIADVEEFISKNPLEIVIFDVQHFPVGFDGNLSVHRELVAFLVSRFDGLLASRSTLGWRSTLSEVWRQRGRVVLGYDHQAVIAAIPDAPLWPAARHLWAQATTLDQLRDFLHKHLRPEASPKWTPTAAMAELTPTALDVITNKYGGLRRMADTVNLEMTKWLRDVWAPRTNAFAVDFVRGTDVIRVAVEFNIQRGRAILARRGNATQSPGA